MEEALASKRFNTRDSQILHDGGELELNGHLIKRDGKLPRIQEHAYEERAPISKIERAAEFFISNQRKAAYLMSSSRLDVACAINLLSHQVAATATKQHFKRFDIAFVCIRDSQFELLYVNVDLSTAEVHVFVDVSFDITADLLSQLDYIVLLLKKRL